MEKVRDGEPLVHGWTGALSSLVEQGKLRLHTLSVTNLPALSLQFLGLLHGRHDLSPCHGGYLFLPAGATPSPLPPDSVHLLV